MGVLRVLAPLRNFDFVQPQTKICTKCKKERTLDKFCKSKGCRFGVNSICKICCNKDGTRWRNNNREKSREAARRWTKENPDRKRRNAQKWHSKNKKKNREQSQRWAKKNPWYRKKYLKENVKRLNKYAYEQQKEKYRTDPKFRLNHNMSNAIRTSLKKKKQGRHWESLVGYTCEDLVKHLESKFKEGMTWENYGEWHIDHKIPKNAFNFNAPNQEDFLSCWALENLQPLWAKENILKGSSVG